MPKPIDFNEEIVHKITEPPLLPRSGATNLPLTLVISVISFLASIALAGYFVISLATKSWTDDLNGAITVQIQGSDDTNIAMHQQNILQLLNTNAQISNIRIIPTENLEAQLAPWFGDDDLNELIPMPVLIGFKADKSLANDLSALREQIAFITPNASVHDHQLWNDRLVLSANMMKAMAFGIFILVVIATIAIVIFATRAGLDANRDIVRVLHLIGASDLFIAKEVQYRFLLLGLRGAALSLPFAILAILLYQFVISIGGDDAQYSPFAQKIMLFQGFIPTIQTLGWLLIVPCMTCLIAAVTARITVLRQLKKTA